MARDFGDAMWRAASHGRPAGDPVAMVRELERALGSKRAVADRLGVSTRTVERWTTTTGQQRRAIRGPAETRVRDTYGKAPEVRRASMSRYRAARIRNKGATLRVKGVIGPMIGGTDYRRQREITVKFTGEAMGPVIDAWLNGDDDAARAALEDALETEYGAPAGFQLGDELTELEFLR